MDVTITVRHCEIPERFRRHLVEKVSKVEQLSPRSRRVTAVVRYEANPRLAPVAYRLELTVHGDGPVVRAEASADEPYAALDLAFAKVAERLRRAHDRKVVRRGRTAGVPERAAADARRSPVGDAGSRAGAGDLGDDAARPSTSDPVDAVPAAESVDLADGQVWTDGASPISIREKTHRAEPMTLDQALYEMELVGHDFFLFVDAGNGLPSVVYRRKGWSYGVIRLSAAPDGGAPSESRADSATLALVD